MRAELQQLRDEKRRTEERKFARVEAAVRNGPVADAIREFVASRVPESAQASAGGAPGGGASADALAAEFQEGYLAVMRASTMHPMHDFVQHVVAGAAAARADAAGKDAQLAEARASVGAQQRLRRVLDAPAGDAVAPAASGSKRARDDDAGVGGAAEARAAKRPRTAATAANLFESFDDFLRDDRDNYAATPRLTKEMTRMAFFGGGGAPARA